MTSVLVHDLEHWNLGLNVAALLGELILGGAVLLLLMRGWRDVADSAARSAQAVELLARIEAMVVATEERDDTMAELLTRIEAMVAASEERDATMEQLLMDTEHYARSHRHAIKNLAEALSPSVVVERIYPTLAEAAELHAAQDGGHEDGSPSSA